VAGIRYLLGILPTHEKGWLQNPAFWYL